jgi:hypothetical protein
VIDAQVGRLFAELKRRTALENTLVVAVSDHGQIDVVEADRNALQMRFLFDRELGHVFAGLNMNAHDLPGEAPYTDAVVASNGGMAHVYLKNRTGDWRDPAPRYSEDVLPVAQAFWEANETGRYYANLKGSLAMILIRSVEQDGWEANYHVYTQGGLQEIAGFLTENPHIDAVSGSERLAHLSGPNSGDMELVANASGGYYFGQPHEGHTRWLGLRRVASRFVPGVVGCFRRTETHIYETPWRIQSRRGRQRKDVSHASLADLVPILQQLFGWH